MNLLCPNCQKMLTVPEQYAGQLMKCPLCAGTFTVPALPPSAPPPPPPPETFGFKEPLPPAPPQLAPSSFTAPPPTQPAAPSPPPPPPLPPGEYTRKASIWFSPKVLQFIPAVCIVLLFFLQLVPWVGFYVGSYSVVTQNAWGAAFATKPTEENDLKALFHWTTEKDLKDHKDDKDFKPNWPDYSVLTIFYLFLYFPTAALTLACVILPFLPLKLPPVVQTLLKWKWALALLLNLLLFFFLVMQLAVGFGMESGIQRGEGAKVAAMNKDENNPLPAMEKAAIQSEIAAHVQITTFVYIVIVLHILIIFTALLMFWLNQRETFNKPYPELDLRW